MTKTITLYGGWAGVHVGDDAILQATIDRIRKVAGPAVRIILLMSTPNETRQMLEDAGVEDEGIEFYVAPRTFVRSLAAEVVQPQSHMNRAIARVRYVVKEWQLSRTFSATALMRSEEQKEPLMDACAAILRSDVLILAGGGYMSATMRLPWLYPTCQLIQMAYRHGIPVVITGQTIGPLATRRDFRVVRRALRKVGKIGVRDDESHELLTKRLGIDSVKVTKEVDIAWLLGSTDSSHLERNHVNEISLSIEQRMVDSTQMDLSLLRSLVLGFPDSIVRLYPHTESDEEYHQSLLSYLTTEIRRRIVLERARRSVLEQQRMMQQSRVCLGTRYHFNVFAASCGTPALALQNNMKLRGLYSDLSAPERCIELSEVGVEAVIKRLKQLLKCRHEISRELRERSKQLRLLAALVLDDAVRL